MRRLVWLLPLALGACQDVSMRKQPRYGWQAPAPIFADGAAAQTPPQGTVAQESAAQEIAPPPVDLALLERGRQRYDIYCSPCHGFGGDGDGVVVRRGFPRPPSFHSAALVDAPAQLFVDTIRQGYGVMYAYADRVGARDRWAIAAYLRALQQARATDVAGAPELREKLDPARRP